jgi:hypothetical protein
MFPPGIPDTNGFRGLLVKDPGNTVNGSRDTAAKIMVLHEKLFEIQRNCSLNNGFSLDGIFVVDSTGGRTNSTIRWKRVAAPTDPPRDWNRYERFRSHLEKAIREATPVPSGIDLGIHNPGDPDITIIPTAAGNYTQIG